MVPGPTQGLVASGAVMKPAASVYLAVLSLLLLLLGPPDAPLLASLPTSLPLCALGPFLLELRADFDVMTRACTPSI